MSDKPGRNDPCYCGSGKKYKQCHLNEDKQQERLRLAQTMAIRHVRRDLLAFARDERFAAAFAAALPHYWNNYYELDNAEEMSEYEALRFFDWFVYDYEQSLPANEGEEKARLIEVYYREKRDDLSSEQQVVLDNWHDASPAGAYELTAYEGQTLQLRDIMTGEEYTAYEGGGRGVVEVGEILLTRLLPLLNPSDRGQWEFSTAAAYLPQDEIADVYEKLAAAKATYLEKHPDADTREFMRHNNHLLVHHALAQAELKKRPPVARLDPHRPDKVTQKVVRQMKRLKR